MKKYYVILDRDEAGWWIATVRGVRGCHTQGKSIQQARERIREALGLFVDDPDRVELVERMKLPREARQLVVRTRAARQRAATAATDAQGSTKRAVEFLTKRLHLSVRDAGELVGVSHQRVQQLLDGGSAA